MTGTAPATAITVILSLGGTATENTDYTATSISTLSIPANGDTGTATITIDPTAETTADSGDETIIVNASGTGVRFKYDSTITLQDGPFVSFPQMIKAHAVYAGTTKDGNYTGTAVSFVVDDVINATGTVTYSDTVAVEPSGTTHDLDFTASTRTIAGTLNEAATAGTKITFTVTATDNMGTAGSTTDDKTATTKVVIIVVDDVCTSTKSTWKPADLTGDPDANLIRDCNILQEARDSLPGAKTWSLESDIRNWQGNESFKMQNTATRIQEIDFLSTRAPTGKNNEIPPVLGALDALETIHIPGHPALGANFKGEIPPELGSLANLKLMWIHSQNFTGKTIPAELGDLAKLGTLRLQENKLTGTIPAELGNLSNLNDLNLSENRLSGSIPPNWARLTPSTINANQIAPALNLANNDLSGSIPHELGRITNLVYLNLNANGLSGNIPWTLGPPVQAEGPLRAK